MPFYEYHTFSYIMYRENIERIKREEAKKADEEARRADDERRMRQEEISSEVGDERPLNGREALMMKIRQNNLIQEKAEKSVKTPVDNTPQFPLPHQETDIMGNIAEILEDEL